MCRFRSGSGNLGQEPAVVQPIAALCRMVGPRVSLFSPLLLTGVGVAVD